MEYNSIKDINNTKEEWNIRVRIIRLWRFYNNLGMIFIDDQGDQIEASVKNYMVSKFEEHLAEHKCLRISNFSVVNGGGKYRETNHPYKISFLESTYVEPCDELSIPLYGFNFTSFSDILSEKVLQHSPIDAIGVILGVGSVQSRGENKKILSVDLKDLENNDMRCDLWNKYADKVLDYMEGKENQTVVMIIHGGKKQIYDGAHISNSFFSTEIYINEDIQEIKSFREKLSKSSLSWSPSSKRTNPNIDDDQTLQTKKTRLQSESDDGTTLELKSFCDRILSIYDGSHGEGSDGEATITEIPEGILIKDTTNPISSIVDSIYSSVSHNLWDTTYWEDRMILCSTIEAADSINKHMLSMIPGEARECYSADTLCESEYDSEFPVPLENLNCIRCSGLPDHILTLKVGVPVVLLKDIEKHAGLCTGTRLQVTQLGCFTIEAKVLSGKSIGQKLFIPRRPIISPDNKSPFRFRRRQFPFAVCFAMTIDESPGQSFSHLGVYIPGKRFLTHEQLYVAISRVKSRSGLKILINDKKE